MSSRGFNSFIFKEIVMKLVIADRMEEDVVELIRELGEVVYQPKDLAKEVADAQVLIVRSATTVDRDLLEAASSLKVVARAGIGIDNIDSKECEKRGIKVVNTPGASRNAVAELALGLIICTMRNVQRAHFQMKNKNWDKKHLTGSEIEGKTLGIIGYGRIGSALGRKAAALGMNIISYNPPPRHEDEIVMFIDELDEFLAKADVISLHTILTDETRHMVNAESISKMKDGVFLINTARGALIDEDALYEACKSGKVAGAAIDVYEEEPYTGKLLELDNVYFTPHLGAGSFEAQMRIGEELVERIRKELD
jgi:D-3-phosphoglycerate dehydrogenase